MITAFVMIVELALTGQHVAIEVASKEECLSVMARVEAGEKLTLTIRANGVLVPVQRVLGCIPKKDAAGDVS